MARDEQGDEGSADVVLLICIKCGREAEFEAGEEAEDLECEKCGNDVFRRFDATASPNEAQEDFNDATERDTATDDTAEDTTHQDLLDLNNP